MSSTREQFEAGKFRNELQHACPSVKANDREWIIGYFVTEIQAAYDAGRSSSPAPYERVWSECPRCGETGIYNGKECAVCWGTGRVTESLLQRESSSPVTRDDGLTTCKCCGCWIAQRDGKWIRVEIYPVPNCPAHEWGAHEPASREEAPISLSEAVYRTRGLSGPSQHALGVRLGHIKPDELIEPRMTVDEADEPTATQGQPEQQANFQLRTDPTGQYRCKNGSQCPWCEGIHYGQTICAYAPRRMTAAETLTEVPMQDPTKPTKWLDPPNVHHGPLPDPLPDLIPRKESRDTTTKENP